MSESLGSNDKRKVSRREFITNQLLGAIASAAIPPTQAHGGILEKLGIKEDFADQFHAANVYFGEKKANNTPDKDSALETRAALLNTFQEIQKIGAELKQRAKKTLTPQESVALNVRLKPFVDEKNRLLAELDPKLMPGLLVTYVQQGLIKKTLVQMYEKAGGNLDLVKRSGLRGVDANILARIKSSMTYTVGRLEKNFGEVTYSKLDFEEKRGLGKTDDTTRNLA